MLEELNGDFLQWLRGFYHVAKTGSVRKAAKLMNRNPSTISYQLRCLEEELNVVLFDRVKRSMRITAEGRKLLAWTISAFETLKGLRSSVSNVGGALKGRIRLAATLPMLCLAAPAIKSFMETYPQVEITLDRDIASGVQLKVNDCEADFGLMPAFRPLEGLEILFSARPLLVYARDRVIPERPDAEDLEKLPFITFPLCQAIASLGYVALDSPLGELIKRRTVLTVNNNYVMLRFIAAGMGVGIMDEAVIKTSVSANDMKDLATSALDHLFPCRLYGAYTLPGKRMSPQSLELLRVLRAHLGACASLFQAPPNPEGNPRLENGRSDSDCQAGGDKPGNDNHKRRALPDGHGV